MDVFWSKLWVVPSAQMECPYYSSIILMKIRYLALIHSYFYKVTQINFWFPFTKSLMLCDFFHSSFTCSIVNIHSLQITQICPSTSLMTIPGLGPFPEKGRLGWVTLLWILFCVSPSNSLLRYNSSPKSGELETFSGGGLSETHSNNNLFPSYIV